ncbi:MAG: zinc ABC transporter substrate-binding protein [bacterium]|nr:zinc ABC transporter substrate-binding protein [bacterium]
MKKSFATCIFILSLTLAIFPAKAQSNRLTVVASVFPLYEFAREVAGPFADVRILLPAGVEPHSWEPKPSDIVFLSRADIFLYVGESMEPWAHDLVGAVKGKGLESVEIMDSSGFAGDDGPDSSKSIVNGGHDQGSDPHFWLDLAQAARAVRITGKILSAKDPGNGEIYTSRAAQYARRLEELDMAFELGLSRCSSTTLVTGGHAAFGHLAKRYGLTQVSIYGLSPDTEPSARHMAAVIKQVRELNVNTVFFEETVNPELARVLSRETGAGMLSLNPVSNLTSAQWQSGTALTDLMEQNLKSLREGLSCE